jgi:hypothetical protein
MNKENLVQITRCSILTCFVAGLVAGLMACQAAPSGTAEAGPDVAATMAHSVEQTMNAQPRTTEVARTPTRIPVTETPRATSPTAVPATSISSATPETERAEVRVEGRAAEPAPAAAALAPTPTRVPATNTPDPGLPPAGAAGEMPSMVRLLVAVATIIVGLALTAMGIRRVAGRRGAKWP